MLRHYQHDILEIVRAAQSDDLVQLDTGAGKTHIEAALAKDCSTLLIAHRTILIRQISEKLAAVGVAHQIVAPKNVMRMCSISHAHKYGRSFVIDSESVVVASLDSFIARHRRGLNAVDFSQRWQIIIDEAHHACAGNKWGKLIALFPKKRLVGFTATPARLDGKPLAKLHGGLFDRLVQAPNLGADSMKKLIESGHLSNFRFFSVPDRYDESMLVMSAGGDYTQSSLMQSIRGAPMAGDAVAHYKRICPTARAVAMCVGLKNAEEVADGFRKAGIAAASIGSHLSASEISWRLDAFASGQIRVLTSVDIISEGFDLPGIQAVILLRKTASFVLYRQWIGRALRPAENKSMAYIIDHAGNLMRHGMPDDRIEWSIQNPPRRAAAILHIPCEQCDFSYPISLRHCPECGHQNRVLDSSWNDASFYINQRKLNIQLVERMRRRIFEEEMQAKTQIDRETKVVIPSARFDSGAVGAACCRLLAWFAESMSGQIPFAELNAFLCRADVSQSSDFLIRNFTVADARAINPQKAMRAYKKWQK